MQMLPNTKTKKPEVNILKIVDFVCFENIKSMP